MRPSWLWHHPLYVLDAGALFYLFRRYIYAFYLFRPRLQLLVERVPDLESKRRRYHLFFFII